MRWIFFFKLTTWNHGSWMSPVFLTRSYFDNFLSPSFQLNVYKRRPRKRFERFSNPQSFSLSFYDNYYFVYQLLVSRRKKKIHDYILYIWDKDRVTIFLSGTLLIVIIHWVNIINTLFWCCHATNEHETNFAKRKNTPNESKPGMH